MSLNAVLGTTSQLAADVPFRASAVNTTSALLFGREYLTTEEAADLLGLRPQTLRKAYSSDGCYFSVVPKKAANRRLYWRADSVRALIEGA
ncbi:helix-turn-helix domain-containing protein [Burkholderia pseudomallei]|uniref:helix-turn-helix domain-containing protein n=1 Tax=Burkholderia pseudomallei TaxID=28450 RepID=UPI001F43CD92|nr:helix-turn-helix domain-containing protein [Burkholderia pseudomallei]